MTRQHFLAAVPSALLCAVATFHLCGVVFADLSAWKGGGFGMFSTVDAPHARFLRISLITEDGETVIVTPPRWAKEVRKIRTMPTAPRIAALGGELLGLGWTHYEIVSSEEQYRTALEDETELVALPRPPDGARQTRLDMGPFGFVRPVEDIEAERRGTQLMEVHTVRIEVWRYRFDQESGGLETQLLRDETFSKPV